MIHQELIINPCKCGGIPYPHEYDDKGNILYTIRCMVCGNIVSLEYTEEEALDEWNEKNSFKIDYDYLNEKYLIHCQMQEVKDKLKIKPITLNGIEQREE